MKTTRYKEEGELDRDIYLSTKTKTLDFYPEGFNAYLFRHK